MNVRALALASVMMTAAACGEIQEASYASMAEAKRSGAVERGWIPGWLPSTTHDLREKHDLDTNGSILRFAYSGPAIPTPEECLRIDPRKARAARLSASWWPRDMPAPGTAAPRRAYFECERGEAFLALTDREGLYWRP